MACANSPTSANRAYTTAHRRYALSPIPFPSPDNRQSQNARAGRQTQASTPRHRAPHRPSTTTLSARPIPVRDGSNSPPLARGPTPSPDYRPAPPAQPPTVPKHSPAHRPPRASHTQTAPAIDQLSTCKYIYIVSYIYIASCIYIVPRNSFDTEALVLRRHRRYLYFSSLSPIIYIYHIIIDDIAADVDGKMTITDR